MLVTTISNKDLGSIQFGKPHGFIFPVQNSGSLPIEITKIIVGCGSCTTAVSAKNKLAAGESTDIRVTFTPGSLGKQKKHLDVEWNRSQNLRLTFTAESYE
jgi:hypothetical protein